MNILYFTEVFVYSGLETLERERERKAWEKRGWEGRKGGRDGGREGGEPFTIMAFDSQL